jgi:hypothetical protein
MKRENRSENYKSGINIKTKLRVGDRRSVCRLSKFIADVQNNPALFAHLVDSLLDNDPVVRMRAAIESVFE